MAEGILRQSYDSTGRKIYPLTVIDGILRSVDVNVMDAHSRGAYAIIDSMKNYDVDFAEADLTTLDVMTRTWDESTRSYSNIVPILSVNDSGFKVDSGKSSTFTGVIKALAPVYNGGKVEFGAFDENAVGFIPTGRFSTKDESNVLSGKIELFNSNSYTPFFVVENGQLSWKTQTGNGLTVNGTQLTYSGSSVVIGDLSAQTSDLTVGRDVTVGRNLHVKRDASLDGSLKVGGGITFNGRLDANADASIKKRLYVYDPSVSGSQLFDVSSGGARVSVDTKITKNLTVNGVITAEDVDSHNLTTNIDELNLAGNLDSDSLYFNYRAGNGISHIYMCGGTNSGTSSGNLTTVISKSLQVGMNSSSYSDSSLLLWTNTSGSPSIVFQRGTYSDGYTDWRLVDDSGILKVQFRDDSTGWKSSAHFKDGGIYIFGDQPSNANRFISSDATDNIYVHTDGKVPLVVNTTEVRRGNASGNAGISLGTSAVPWNKIYGNDQYALDHVYVGGSSHSGRIVTVDWDSISAKTNGSPSTLYLSYGGGPTNVNGQMNTKDVIPQSNNTYNIGSSTYRYKNGYYSSLDVLYPWNIPSRSNDVHPADSADPMFVGNRGYGFYAPYIRFRRGKPRHAVPPALPTYQWDDVEVSESTKHNFTDKMYSSAYQYTGTYNKLRVYFDTFNSDPERAHSLYAKLKRLLICVATEGASSLTVAIKGAFIKTHGTDYTDSDYTIDYGEFSLAGQSGPNSIPLGEDGITFGAYGQTDHIGSIRLEFTKTGTGNPVIHSVHLIGGMVWETNGSYLARTGHLYNWDKDQNVIFYKSIIASTASSHSIVTHNNELNLAGNLSGTTLYFNYRGNSGTDIIKMNDGRGGGGLSNVYMRDSNVTSSSYVADHIKFEKNQANGYYHTIGVYGVGQTGDSFGGDKSRLTLAAQNIQLSTVGYLAFDSGAWSSVQNQNPTAYGAKGYINGMLNVSIEDISGEYKWITNGVYGGHNIVCIYGYGASGEDPWTGINITGLPQCSLLWFGLMVKNASPSHQLTRVQIKVNGTLVHDWSSVGKSGANTYYPAGIYYYNYRGLRQMFND